jgi:hypothetical protein
VGSDYTIGYWCSNRDGITYRASSLPFNNPLWPMGSAINVSTGNIKAWAIWLAVY